MSTKRVDVDKPKLALNDIKNASKHVEQITQLSKEEWADDYDGSVYDPIKGSNGDKGEWEGGISDAEITLMFDKLYFPDKYPSDEPEEPVLSMYELEEKYGLLPAVPEGPAPFDMFDYFGGPPPLPTDDSFCLNRQFASVWIADAPMCVDADMRPNLSLPYGDESMNQSMFELNLSDDDE